MKCTCENPIFREGENFCRNCGGDKFVQFSKKSEGGEYYWEVVVRTRWYVIIITSREDEKAFYEFKQKDVKSLEARTWLKGQELADLIASKTTAVRYYFNGKYGSSSISYDLRSEKQKEEDERRREEQKKEEEERKKLYQIEKERKEKILFSRIDLNKKIKINPEMKQNYGYIRTWLYDEYTIADWVIQQAVIYIIEEWRSEMEFTFNFSSYEELKELEEKFYFWGGRIDNWKELLLDNITIYE
jgi:hypothetical protein